MTRATRLSAIGAAAMAQAASRDPNSVQPGREPPTVHAELGTALHRIAELESALRGCVEYAERFADLADEPEDGDCRSIIAAALTLLAKE